MTDNFVSLLRRNAGIIQMLTPKEQIWEGVQNVYRIFFAFAVVHTFANGGQDIYRQSQLASN